VEGRSGLGSPGEPKGVRGRHRCRFRRLHCRRGDVAGGGGHAGHDDHQHIHVEYDDEHQYDDDRAADHGGPGDNAAGARYDGNHVTTGRYGRSDYGTGGHSSSDHGRPENPDGRYAGRLLFTWRSQRRNGHRPADGLHDNAHGLSKPLARDIDAYQGAMILL